MKRLFALSLCLCLALSACAPRQEAQEEDHRYDYLNNALDFHARRDPYAVLSGFSDQEIAAAGTGLVAAGVLTQEELDALEPASAATRAQFIWLTVAAMGVQVPTVEEADPRQSWYAPYIQAGYDAGLFPDQGRSLSFLPTDGFLFGDDGYAPMLDPMSRADAALVLDHLAPGAQLLPDWDTRETYGVEEDRLSLGATLVCAWQVHQGGYLPTPDPDPVPTVQELLAGGRIIHAGGYAVNDEGKQTSYTNSVEALLRTYATGPHIIEFDFTETSDGHLACIHDWLAELAPQITEGQPLPLEEWLSVKIYRNYSPLCLESLAAFLRQHPDLYIMTDVKSNNVGAAQLIAQTCPDLLDRFIIQIYQDGQYDPVRALGFSHIVYTFYNLSAAQSGDTDHMAQFAAGHPLLAFTYGASRLEEPGYTEAMLATGVPLCVHTLNDPADIQRAYGMGITAVYTDVAQ